MGVDGEIGGRGDVGGSEHARSGSTVEEAVERFEAGTLAEGDHTPVGRADTGESRLEQMVEVEQAGTGDTPERTAPVVGPGPHDVGAGGAQRIEGARASDRAAGGVADSDDVP
jgi:hypothetical protein